METKWNPTQSCNKKMWIWGVNQTKIMQKVCVNCKEWKVLKFEIFIIKIKVKNWTGEIYFCLGKGLCFCVSGHQSDCVSYLAQTLVQRETEDLTTWVTVVWINQYLCQACLTPRHCSSHPLAETFLGATPL